MIILLLGFQAGNNKVKWATAVNKPIMTQATSYMNRRKKNKGPNKGLLIVVALIFIFIAAVIWFRSSGNKVDENQPLSVLPPIELYTTGDTTPAMEVGIIDTINLTDVTGNGTSTGSATREVQDGFYRHVAKAYLPEPGEEEFYEGWLVRPSPFDYFSTGNMVHNESGEWVLEWFGEFQKDYSAYTRVVITLEPLNDADPGPAEHILEGEF